MAGSTIATVKAALVTALTARSGLANVQVAWGDPGEVMRQECIIIGDVRGTQSPRAIKPPPTVRWEEYEIEVAVHVVTPATTQQRADERALTLANEIEAALYDNPTLSAAGLAWATVGRYEVLGGVDPDGRWARVILGVECHARLT